MEQKCYRSRPGIAPSRNRTGDLGVQKSTPYYPIGAAMTTTKFWLYVSPYCAKWQRQLSIQQQLLLSLLCCRYALPCGSGKAWKLARRHCVACLANGQWVLLWRSYFCYSFCKLVLRAYLTDRENWTHPEGLNSHQIVRTIMKEKGEVKETGQKCTMTEQVMLPPGVEPGTLCTVVHTILPHRSSHSIIEILTVGIPRPTGVIPRGNSNNHHCNYISVVITG